MKKIQTILGLCLLTIGILVACKKKNTDQILSPDQLGVGSYIKIDSTVSNEFNYSAITTSTVSWMVHSIGEPINKITAYVSTNGSTNKATWKKIKDITPGGDGKSVITISGQELATALGIPPTSLSPGNQYTIYTELTTTSGKTYSIINTNSELESAAAYNMAFRLPGTITCPFNPADLGPLPANFQVVKDAWEDFDPGDILQVTAATSNSITLVAYPAPAYGTNRQPEVITVNPANGRASIAPPQYIGNYGAVQTKISTSTSKNSYVFTCTGDIILYQDILYGSTTYRSQLLRLKKI